MGRSSVVSWPLMRLRLTLARRGVAVGDLPLSGYRH
jgi:hypothetical protein